MNITYLKIRQFDTKLIHLLQDSKFAAATENNSVQETMINNIDIKFMSDINTHPNSNENSLLTSSYNFDLCTWQ